MYFHPALLRSPGSQLVNLGFFSIKWYGLLIALSIILGLNLSKKLARYRGIDPHLVSEILPSLILSSIIGARIYYVIFEYRQFSGDNFFTPIKIFNIYLNIPSFLAIWEGGIAIHGALLGGFLSIYLFCKSKKIPLKIFLDLLMPSVILGQAIGRWGNFFNNEAFGIPTNLPWKVFIPLSNRPIIFANSQFFHPTFLYESLWNLIIFALLIFILIDINYISCIEII